MDTKTQPGAADRVYIDFEPFYEWARDKRQITVLLAEYRRDQFKVQVTSKPALKVMGERLVAGNRWHRFDLELPLPSDYDTDDVLAKFEGGKLSVKFGKLDKPRETTPPQPEEVPRPSDQPQKPEEVPRPSDQPQKVDQQKNDQADTPKAKEDKAEERTNKEVSDQKTPQKEPMNGTEKSKIETDNKDKVDQEAKTDKPRKTTPQPEEVPRPSDQPQKVDQQKNDQADTPKAKEDKAEERTNKEVSDQKTPQKEPMNETEKSKIETDNKDKVDQEAKTKGLTETAATSKAPETRVANPVTRSKTKLIDFTRSFTPNKFDKKVVRDSKAGIKKWKKWVIWMVLILLVVGLGFYARKAIRSTIEEFNFQELEFTPEDYFLEL